jgi:ATP-dependent DNA helicase RecQ
LRSYVEDGGKLSGERLRTECSLPPDAQARVLAQFEQLGFERLTPIYEALGGSVDYEDLHLLRLIWLAGRGTA